MRVGKELNNFRGLSWIPLKAQSFFTQKSIQLGLEGSPAPADFLGLDLAVCDAFQIGRTGYFKILAGLFGGQNVILAVSILQFSRVTITIEPAEIGRASCRERV